MARIHLDQRRKLPYDLTPRQQNDRVNRGSVPMEITRRTAFVGAAAATIGLSRRAAAQSFEFKPNQRYPDAAVEILDPSLEKSRLFSSTVEQLATGMRWAEGPVWFGDGRYVLVSDIPNNRIMRYDEANGNWGVFRQPSNFANGHARDRQGRLLSCEHLTRRVTRTEFDGKVTVLADGFDGKRLNSPNDIVCKSDGSIWFTDPPFGLQSFYEGRVTKAELPTNVYRWDPQSEKLEIMGFSAPRKSKKRTLDALDAALAAFADETKKAVG